METVPEPQNCTIIKAHALRLLLHSRHGTAWESGEEKVFKMDLKNCSTGDYTLIIAEKGVKNLAERRQS